MSNKQRELKFRAWNKDKHEMLPPFSMEHLLLNYNSEYGRSRVDISMFNFDGPDNYIIQQYTGLKDKNGKEIYEGDIIRYFVDDLGESIDNEVRFVTGCFIPDIWRRQENEKVIGNIFENPELNIPLFIYEKGQKSEELDRPEGNQ